MFINKSNLSVHTPHTRPSCIGLDTHHRFACIIFFHNFKFVSLNFLTAILVHEPLA